MRLMFDELYFEIMTLFARNTNVELVISDGPGQNASLCAHLSILLAKHVHLGTSRQDNSENGMLLKITCHILVIKSIPVSLDFHYTTTRYTTYRANF